MKYLYKQTGVVVESDVKLDSAIFKLINETNNSKSTDQGKARKTTKKAVTNKKE